VTRDEHRAKCIEAMFFGYGSLGFYEFEDAIPASLTCRRLEAAFDAISKAGARVVPVEATDEIAAGRRSVKWARDLNSIWRAMAEAGDLTNLPEKRP
jgi:hypothetical protein